MSAVRKCKLEEKKGLVRKEKEEEKLCRFQDAAVPRGSASDPRCPSTETGGFLGPFSGHMVEDLDDRAPTWAG